MPFNFKKLKIEDIVLIEPKVFGDNRGFFMETYKKSDFVENGIKDAFNQDNHSKSTKGVLRGLHYQKGAFSQSKIIRCVKGAILDVAVDLRKDSKTFTKWVAEELSEENKNMLYIPQGFAHGFVALTEEVEILYKASGEYSPENDRGVRWNDPDINVKWGIEFEPLISEKDSKQPYLKDIKEEDLF
ncbi:MAG: dTDP-4-dehydrorhamnose 3,5-epimerase [Candidatus Gastranaerophilales bacterium]|nr:dTDP-4-dehydrorhamnose 3,5-epimerase [Candidatus Gastranaerophilales bacterium]